MKTRTLVLVVAGLAVPASSYAQGFGVYEHSACSMARAAAAVADPCDDGSAIVDNPAAIVGAKGLTFSGGGLLVAGRSTFRSDDGRRSEVEPALSPVPFGYFTYGLSTRLAIGVGLYAPYGLSIEWPLEFSGRFVGFDSTLETIYVQPVVAYAINRRISVGGGPTFARGSVELNRREDLAPVPLGSTGLTFAALVPAGTDFATSRLSASGATGTGFHLGTRIAITPNVRVGVRYLAPIDLSYDGEATFTQVTGVRVEQSNPLGLPVGTPLDGLVSQVLESLPSQPARTEIEMPAQLVVGTSVNASTRLKILVDYHWVDWSAFDSVVLDFSNPATPDEVLHQNYRDSHALRFGGEWTLKEAVRVRSGYAFTSAAAPDETVTPLLPDAQRHHLTAGVGLHVRPGITLDLAYQFVDHAARRGRTVNPPAGVRPTTALNSGVYQSHANIVGITMTITRR